MTASRSHRYTKISLATEEVLMYNSLDECVTLEAFSEARLAISIYQTSMNLHLNSDLVFSYNNFYMKSDEKSPENKNENDLNSYNKPSEGEEGAAKPKTKKGSEGNSNDKKTQDNQTPKEQVNAMIVANIYWSMISDITCRNAGGCMRKWRKQALMFLTTRFFGVSLSRANSDCWKSRRNILVTLMRKQIAAKLNLKQLINKFLRNYLVNYSHEL